MILRLLSGAVTSVDLFGGELPLVLELGRRPPAGFVSPPRPARPVCENPLEDGLGFDPYDLIASR